MVVRKVRLEDKYTQNSGRVFLTGNQALARLPMLQQERDRAAGINTAGFISGYRGSPLGGLDKTLWQASSFLEDHNIYFKPGVNEDLAATAVWGSQQVNIFEGAKYDGVFAMWYGKGPGVDRSGDVFKHANHAGTSKHGGVLVVAGDDHGCKSSTLPHQTEYAFVDAMMPILNPAGVQEVIDLGLMGWAMSRYSGCWVALKTIAETVDASFSTLVDAQGFDIVIPEKSLDVHARWPDKPLEQEFRLHHVKLGAALEFARLNHLNRITIDSPQAKIGIVSTGKSYLDVLQALSDLGIDDALAAEIGLRVYKVGMPWPLEPNGIREFASGLDEVIVVEEKRGLIEDQLTSELYNWHS
ncbi:MAG: indolepyruvate ferredoxin oxidoreductase, partial [Sulfitobacter sp.]